MKGYKNNKIKRKFKKNADSNIETAKGNLKSKTGRWAKRRKKC